MTTPLPPFAKAWMEQWKQAAPELARVRAEELRALDSGANEASVASLADPGRMSGLVEQQAWFMRAMLLDYRKRCR